MTVKEKIYAVLTGDLVKSSRLTSVKSKGAMENLKRITKEFAEQHPKSVVGRMDTFRHDSWQLLLEQPALWNGLERGVVPLIDCVVGDWTPTESRAVYGAPKGLTQEETARNWPLHKKTGKRPTRQAVGDSLVRAHWNTVDTVLRWVETEIRLT